MKKLSNICRVVAGLYFVIVSLGWLFGTLTLGGFWLIPGYPLKPLIVWLLVVTTALGGLALLFNKKAKIASGVLGLLVVLALWGKWSLSLWVTVGLISLLRFLGSLLLYIDPITYTLILICLIVTFFKKEGL